LLWSDFGQNASRQRAAFQAAEAAEETSLDVSDQDEPEDSTEPELVFPDTFAAIAFEHLDHLARAGIEDAADQRQSLAAGAALFGRDTFQLSDLLSPE
jgi:hypothetical protein